MGKGRVAGRVRLFVGYRGSGRVKFSPGRVQEKWHVDNPGLAIKIVFTNIGVFKIFQRQVGFDESGRAGHIRMLCTGDPREVDDWRCRMSFGLSHRERQTYHVTGHLKLGVRRRLHRFRSPSFCMSFIITIVPAMHVMKLQRGVSCKTYKVLSFIINSTVTRISWGL